PPPAPPTTLARRARHAREEFRTTPMLEMPGYDIVTELGRGGMGVVYKARARNEGRFVAIKMLRDGVLADAKHLARFHSEARTLESLQHPNFLKIYEIGEFQGRPFLSLEFADGGNLADRIRNALPARATTAALIEALAGAMQHAPDRGIVHRDLKPPNILLRTRDDGQGTTADWDASASRFGLGNSYLPMIADFGLVKHL